MRNILKCLEIRQGSVSFFVFLFSLLKKCEYLKKFMDICHAIVTYKLEITGKKLQVLIDFQLKNRQVVTLSM